MEDAVVECVPNFSEGRDPQVLEALRSAVRGVSGCELLDVSPGADTNRTVLTFAGRPDAVVAAALAAAEAARPLLDMRRHTGAHPRLGALDVCPLVPVRGITLEQCGQLARDMAGQLAKLLDVPIYLYGAAVSPGPEFDYRRTVPQIRAGEYEGLQEKLKQPEWKPDCGPCEWRPSWGASIVGARPFLLAYNVNVLATKEQAHRIALNVREAGRGPGQPGRLRSVQGIGWWLQEHGIAQVSLNLSAPEVTPLHAAFEAVCEEASALGVGVAGSELVGLVPLSALTDAGRFYAEREGLLLLEDSELVALAVARLGLSQLAPFDPKERVLELRLGMHDAAGPLASAPLRSLLRDIGARSAAPGGGVVSAIVAAMGAALGRMVAQLTWGKRQFEAVEADIRRLLPLIHQSTRALEAAADRDNDAFAGYMASLKLPKSTAQQASTREAAQQRWLVASAEAPLRVLQEIRSLWEPLQQLATVCNAAAACDLRVAAHCLEAAARGARYNVDVNAAQLRDATAARGMREEAACAVDAATRGRDAVLRALDLRKETAQAPL